MTKPRIPLIEWIAAAVGFALVAATLGFLAFRAVSEDRTPPSIVLRVESVERVASGWLVRIRALNEGERTAADVKVEGTLKRGGKVVETAETSFKFLPPRSHRSGGLYFSQDPSQLELELAPKGYESP